ncbi:MAG: MiaB/RimO family radical SAM methylthiotransferase [Candidatus Omnitrophica bacterium]|nr:MiaB/RimO family radical SAM methylthiotransferase [Candidatus Omnitrophota bacterium]MBU1869969.1 MiaB/RimO family radical SAM methylthiotransferase [Candidatus Omnitrophota bacterium]
MKAKIGIISLGCPRNLVDSESITGRLSGKGYSIVDLDKADVAIVNTCAFIDDAKRESIDVILDLARLKKEGRLKKIIVYGCLSERYKDELAGELIGIDAFVGRLALDHEVNRFPITPGYFAYLKICESCVNSCSYCIIPKIKGKLASLDQDSILSKVKLFNEQRISELNIIGQDITGYGLDLYKSPKLDELLRKIVDAAGDIGWIRLLYLYPKRITGDLLKIIAQEPKICKYIDLPIQHINNRILKLMNRHTTKEEIASLIGRVRKIIPGVAIRTSVIVGFPSETDKEFEELLDFTQEARFDRLGAFIYSREEGTAAYNLKSQITQKVKEERLNAMMSSQQKVSAQLNSHFLGKTVDVLIEEKEEGRYLGRSQFDAPEVDGSVFVSSKRSLSPGEFVKVKITDTLEYDLVGEETR